MYLVFDIGGTNTRIAKSIDGKTILDPKIIPTPKEFAEGMQVFKQTAMQLLNGEKVDKIAGGIAGILDKEKTRLVITPHINSDWVQKPLKGELEQLFNAPVKLENDTAVNGLGEANYGAGKGQEIVAYITISTGVGGVKIENGRIDENALGFEIGHQIINPDGNLCNCGGKGHWEAYIAGSALEKIYHQKGEEIKDPIIWDEIAKYTAIGLNNVIVHWSPDIVVLGGAVSQSIPLDKVEVYLKENLKVFPQPPKVVKATLGQDAGLYGALELLK